MSEFESHGSGFGGRVHGPLFDARHILMPASMILTTLGETVQTEADQRKAAGVPLPEFHDPASKVIELMATMPLDAKALGLASAAAAAVTLYHAGKTYRNIEVENSIIAAGLSKDSAVESRGKRAWKRTLSTVVAGAAAYGAYRAGVPLSQGVDIAASLGTMGAGAGYLLYQKKRMTGRF